jgi:hypothetical protein
MKKTYTPLIVGGLVLGGLYLWRKAKAERDPYRAMFEAAAKAPTVIEPGKRWRVLFKNESQAVMSSEQLQQAIKDKPHGGVLSYIDESQL